MEWMERRQVPIYLVALVGATWVGLAFPSAAPWATVASNPALTLMLYVTFLGLSFTKIGKALRDWRFLSAVIFVNFTIVPVVVWLLSRMVVPDQGLLIGVVIVLLAPCVDYVIVFTGIAGGAKERILVAAPLLMIGQLFLLPLYLWLFVGTEVIGTIDFTPFGEAFLWFIFLPLLAAAGTQLGATHSRRGRRWERIALGSMVPLMAITLTVVVISQISRVGERLNLLLLVVPVYLLFAAVMVPIGMFLGRAAGLDVAGRRAIVFSGVTRNSLVVLPLVLTLPAAFDLAALAVVTQTLTELIIMVGFVRLIPRLIPVCSGRHG